VDGLFTFIVKLINLLFSVCFATGYVHSGEINIFKSSSIVLPFRQNSDTDGQRAMAYTTLAQRRAVKIVLCTNLPVPVCSVCMFIANFAINVNYHALS